MSDFCYRWPILQQVIRQAELMDRMVEQVGVPVRVIATIDDGQAWYAARTACLECPSSTRCRGWLDAAPAPPTQAPSFCPNALLFQRCLAPPMDE